MSVCRCLKATFIPNRATCSLLVIIGFVAAFLISIFPFRVQSAKKSLRLGIAKSLDMVSALFASEVEGIINEAQMTDDAYDPNERTSIYRTKILALVVSLGRYATLHISD